MIQSQGPLRVLVLDEYFPFPLDSGKPIRTWNLLKRVTGRHDVRLLCYADAHRLPPSQSPIKSDQVSALDPDSGPALYMRLFLNLFSLWPYSVTKHHTRRFQRALMGLLRHENYDLIQIEWTPYASYVPDLTGLPVIITTHNIESQIWHRRAQAAGSFLARWFFRQQAQKMEVFEKKVLNEAAWVTTVSEPDAATVRQWGQQRVSIVDNGVDVEFYRDITGDTDDGSILFLASLDWQPNVDGLYYFLECIWPVLLRQEPRLRLIVAGRGPSVELRGKVAATANTTLAGEVTDVRPYLQDASVVVVPLRIGGGSRLKILEAMAAGKAIVSTSVGAEGLLVKDHQHLRLADTPAAFSTAVHELLRSKEERQRLGANGRQLVQEKYGWDESASKLEAAWYKALAPRAPAGNGD
jgi:glycosyltransferase involved in cell wall biosynthesis